jgi:hypothetical protein
MSAPEPSRVFITPHLAKEGAVHICRKVCEPYQILKYSNVKNTFATEPCTDLYIGARALTSQLERPEIPSPISLTPMMSKSTAMITALFRASQFFRRSSSARERSPSAK